MTENVVEVDLTRHKLIITENGEIVRAEGNIIVFDDIGKHIVNYNYDRGCS